MSEGPIDATKRTVRRRYPDATVVPVGWTLYVVMAEEREIGPSAATPEHAWAGAYRIMQANK